MRLRLGRKARAVAQVCAAVNKRVCAELEQKRAPPPQTSAPASKGVGDGNLGGEGVCRGCIRRKGVSNRAVAALVKLLAS